MRNSNVIFRLDDVYHLILKLMASTDEKLTSSYFPHLRKVEKTLQNADEYTERVIEPPLKDKSIKSDNGDEEEW